MTTERKVEIFTVGCPVCENAVALVKRLAGDSCDVSVLDMRNPDVAERAEQLGIASVPAVLIDGQLASCCAGRGIDEDALRAAGLGEAAE